MQTFLPYPDFVESARCLDSRRLGKQRPECLQILKALGGSGGWSSHPATKMWSGCQDALKAYSNACVLEWTARGYKNSMAIYQIDGTPTMPRWLGDERFHASHRSNLLRKDPVHYGRFGWSESPDLEYHWPV